MDVAVKDAIVDGLKYCFYDPKARYCQMLCFGS